MLETKHNQLEEVMKKLDFIRNSFKSVNLELAHLKIEKEKLEVITLNVIKNLRKMNE